MVKAYNESTQPKKNVPYSPRAKATPKQIPNRAEREAQHALCKDYGVSLRRFQNNFAELVEKKKAENPGGYMDDPEIKNQFNTACQHEKWKKAGGPTRPSRARPGGMNPDHQHPVSLGGNPLGALKWADSDVNQTCGPSMGAHDPTNEPGGLSAHPSCGCT